MLAVMCWFGLSACRSMGWMDERKRTKGKYSRAEKWMDDIMLIREVEVNGLLLCVMFRSVQTALQRGDVTAPAAGAQKIYSVNIISLQSAVELHCLSAQRCPDSCV